MGDDGLKAAGGPDGRSGRRAALRDVVEGVGGGMGDDGPKAAGGPDGRSGRRAALRAATEEAGGGGAAE